MDINTCFETTKDYHTVVFYSHLIPVLITVVVSIFALVKSNFSFSSKIFAFFSGGFCLWLIGDTIVWTSSNYNLVNFFWAPLDYINVVFFLLGAYLLAFWVRERDISFLEKILLLLLALPAWWVTVKNESIISFYQPACEALNSDFLSYYKFVVEFLVIAYILIYSFFSARKASLVKKWQIFTVCLALVLFFAVFSVTEYISSQTGIYEINLYSLFILPVFLFIIIYSITNLEILKLRLIGSQLLAYVLVIMVGSQFFFLKDTTDRTLTAITFFLSLGFGVLLVRSGKREAAAREKIEELDKQKDAVLHMVAHQLNGPVTTINFISELLLDGTYGELSSEQAENISMIRAASKKMGSQSEMVLNAAKISSGKLPIELGPLDLNQLFKEVVEEAKIHAKEKKVNFNVSLPKEKLPTAILDKKYTQMAIDNLLSNAIKYTALKSQDGKAYLSVTLKDNILTCIIKDTGIGIPKKDQENVFKELFRASNAGKEGNGLGLHVAMGAIQAQGGKIRFESEEGIGTTFYVEMPLKLA